MPASDPTDRNLIARKAALTRWARENGTVNAERGQAGLTASFERAVDPDNSLTPAERARRVECARKAHMIGLARASAKARAAKRVRAVVAEEMTAALAELDADGEVAS